ncbi:hypothetical protein A8709_20035 [Paenibacillus pectinilyticus]|uniref:DUF2178 domain-containing protein n=1 Tax=Paenibacillus pectinilyticus TaxID=512399 RepID=A0A1C1A0H9_9BACL|nr:hypothetical protein [Paenibacillus pectinilyticus]OCT13865.1 hypothetical protein A8709_20035 [Paenibacillus pectinilyticus]
MSGNSSYILVIVIGVILLAGLTYMNLRKISRSTADLTQLKKRTLLWSEVSLALFVVQLFFRDRNGGFLLFFGILTLFTGAHYVGVLYHSRKKNR